VFNARAVIDAGLAAVDECGSAVAFTVAGGTTRYAVNQPERGMADGTLEDANPRGSGRDGRASEGGWRPNG
jgi:hypothetical protein